MTTQIQTKRNRLQAAQELAQHAKFLKWVVGGGLRRERLAKGLSLREASDLCGVSRQTFWYWEIGRAIPRDKAIVKLRKIIGK